jgi:hypothetical protein
MLTRSAAYTDERALMTAWLKRFGGILAEVDATESVDEVESPRHSVCVLCSRLLARSLALCLALALALSLMFLSLPLSHVSLSLSLSPISLSSLSLSLYLSLWMPGPSLNVSVCLSHTQNDKGGSQSLWMPC